MLRGIATLALCLVLVPGFAQRRDSVYTASEQFQVTKLIVPAVLVTAGTVASVSPWYQAHVDTPVRDWAAQVSGGKPFLLDDYLQFVPAVAYAVAAPLVPGDHDWRERMLVLGTSFAAMMAITFSIKGLSGVERPNFANRMSFPSGHSAQAFFAAELIRLEYGWGWGLAAYAAAVGTGFLRVYNQWHWTSDVLAGAGVGILSAHIGYWLLPLERKWFALPYVAPTPQGTYSGVSLTYRF